MTNKDLKNNDVNVNVTGLYLFYDRIAGLYSQPFTYVTRAFAIREFNNYCQNAKYDNSDFELYYVGDFDIISGVINSIKPEFVVRGVNDEK